MAFSTATIIAPSPYVEDDGGGGVLVWWECSDPDGTLFQVYVNRVLTWHGTARQVTLPTPIEKTIYQVGTVGFGEENTDFSADLPGLQGNGDRALLTWHGGQWEELAPPGSGMDAFNIYGESTPGGGIDYGTILATVPVGVPNIETGGYGMGGYGAGGYGSGGGFYTWTSGRLTNGTWHYGVRPIDKAGNQGTTREQSVTISIPPEPPARNTAGLRLTLSYNPISFVATLSWLASPG